MTVPPLVDVRELKSTYVMYTFIYSIHAFVYNIFIYLFMNKINNNNNVRDITQFWCGPLR
jgi:hypothetical protein